MKQRPQHLMSQLAARGHTVCYCDLTRSDEHVSAAQEIEPRLFRVFDHERWLREQWPSLRRELQQPVLVWCCLPRSPSQLYLDYQPDALIYDCADDCPEWYASERELAAAADLIVCSSEPLLQRLRRHYPKRDILLVRNGYDPAMRLHLPSDGEEQADRPLSRSAPDGGRSQIGYVGAWARWIDESLVREMAKRLGAEVTVIGPSFGRKLGTAASRDPIRFLGLKRHDELAEWIRRFDVCLIPFRKLPIALAANPIKAYEYMAAGKPVVSTDLPECRLMEPYVDVAADRRTFIRMVARRLEEPGGETPRRQFALQNTWERRGAAIDAWIRKSRFVREPYGRDESNADAFL